jgi:hypothetical protein
MGIRETANEKPGIVIASVGGLVLIVAATILWRGCAAGSAAGSDPVLRRTTAFFSTDDGKSYFVDDLANIPPFKTSDGKTAYRAHVVQCPKGDPFVLYLERYSDEDKKKLEQALKADGGQRAARVLSRMASDVTLLVKKSGAADRAWVKLIPANAKQLEGIILHSCPDGSEPAAVAPE